MAKQTSDDPNQVIVKKYSNRRLYDSTNKQYVTLDDLAELIRNGKEVKVIDSQSGADISKVILIQVILESEKNKQDILPVSFLHMLIKYGNRVAKDFFENYFLMMFQPYFSAQENLKKNVQMWKDMGWFPGMGPGMGLPPNFDKFNFKDMTFPDTGEGKSGDGKSGDESSSDDKSGGDVKLLMEKIKELEQKVESLDSDD